MSQSSTNHEIDEYDEYNYDQDKLTGHGGKGDLIYSLNIIVAQLNWAIYVCNVFCDFWCISIMEFIFKKFVDDYIICI